jgi:threonine dehydratase
MKITLQDVYLARKQGAAYVRKTPLVESHYLSVLCGADVFLKLENLQNTGSFKIRGAANKLLNLTNEERQNGVITVSSGNHGKAVSTIARQMGIRSVVGLTGLTPPNKIKAIQDLGAEALVHGKTYDEALDYALKIQKEQRLTYIHPFDDPYVIAGQGTIALELFEDLPEIETVIVPLSGGGLFGGIAFVLKTVNKQIRTIGVSMEKGPAMVESLKAGRLVNVVEEPSLADALIGGLGPENRYSMQMVAENIDDIVLVSEEEIGRAMVFALEEHHLVIEGGGAVGIAALLSQKVKSPRGQIAVVLSGGNVNITTLLSLTCNKGL